MKNTINNQKAELESLSQQIKTWGKEFGFQQVGIADINLQHYEERYLAWIAQGFHGKMHYLAKHGLKRTRPRDLIPETLRIISVRMDYFPPETDTAKVLFNKHKAYISRYALGRDYHKLIRSRLLKLAAKIQNHISPFGFRVFCDSAPVLEKPIAEKAGLGWIGKHTNLINAKAGSWFFLGEIYTDLPLICDEQQNTQNKSHCGSCSACIDICPTGAIVAPYKLDARRCISYLTIELREEIPLELRELIGNRIYGCDDCQLVCPWNKFAKFTHEKDFHPRHELHTADLLDLFAWTEQEFLRKTEGSAIRRIGYVCWLRNIAVALGNAPPDEKIVQALKGRLLHPSAMLLEHINWALERQLRWPKATAGKIADEIGYKITLR